MKKVLAFVLGALLAAGAFTALTGCGGKGDDGTVKVLLMANSYEDAFYAKHFKEVEEQLGVKIDYTGVAAADYYNSLRRDLTADTMPDIFYVRPADVRQFVSDGLIAPIDSYVEAQSDVDLSQINQTAIDIYRYDADTKKFETGSLYALPKDLSVQQLGYNRALVEKNRQKIESKGLKVPWEMDWATENYTWDEFKQMALLCADASDPKNPIYGCDIPNIEILTWSFGSDIISDDMQSVQVDTDALKRATEYQASLIASGAAYNSSDSFADFTLGKLAFYGETNSYDIAKFDDFFAKIDAEWDIMPWPVADKTKPTSWTGKITSAGFAVSDACANKELATKVMLTLLSTKTQEKLVSDEKLMLPLYNSMAEAYVSSAYDEMYSPKSRSVYMDVISGKNGRFSVQYKTYDLDWYEPLKTFLESIVAADKTKALSIARNQDYAALQRDMQQHYDETKNK